MDMRNNACVIVDPHIWTETAGSLRPRYLLLGGRAENYPAAFGKHSTFTYIDNLYKHDFGADKSKQNHEDRFYHQGSTMRQNNLHYMPRNF